jgi:tetratricopeptide (TPR) repeat protein
MTSRQPRRRLAALLFASGVALCCANQSEVGAQALAARTAATYVGSAACALCHAKAYEAWRGSQHDRAMQEANDRTVLGSFAGARFSHAGVTSRFFRRDGRFFVNTDGPDGKHRDFEIRYTFGLHPLQQYLIEGPGGRLQALGIAWDSRPKAQGGQRWFHLYPGRKLEAGDPMHWTGLEQTWNYQCADCHSTNVRKNYDPATRTYRTAWSELSVGCEACHGPGSSHVAWARQDESARLGDATKGLTIALDQRRGVAWTIDSASGTATRSRPPQSGGEIAVCARCHSRRGQFSDAWHPGSPLGDAFRVSLIEPGLYYADGQIRDEVYNHGSFLQSRMHAKGVTCSDCHEAHTQKLRASGNAVCGQCHAAARFDATSHHRHERGSAGAACVSCHMPTTTYMVVDPRRDHSMRIPRPDRTLSIGTPNACNRCHSTRTAKWAADAIARWHPERKPGFQTFAETLAAGDRGAPGASTALAKLVADTAQPGFARASAVGRLLRYPGRDTLPALDKALDDLDPLVRSAAARALRDADPALRARLLPRLLADPVREVRMEGARGLAGPPEPRLGPGDRARFASALAEYVEAARFNADRPEAHADLGSLAAARGQTDAAVAAYRMALELDPTYAPASVNLADLYRDRGLERDAERVLREAIKADPTAAGPRHALGLSLVRQKRAAEALAVLADAARLDPGAARYAYVYGVALHDAGKRAQAISTLEEALARHPYDRDILLALATYARDRGDVATAAQRARRLAELEPDSPDIARLARELESSSPRGSGRR